MLTNGDCSAFLNCPLVSENLNVSYAPNSLLAHTTKEWESMWKCVQGCGILLHSTLFSLFHLISGDDPVALFVWHCKPPLPLPHPLLCTFLWVCFSLSLSHRPGTYVVLCNSRINSRAVLTGSFGLWSKCSDSHYIIRTLVAGSPLSLPPLPFSSHPSFISFCPSVPPSLQILRMLWKCLLPAPYILLISFCAYAFSFTVQRKKV